MVISPFSGKGFFRIKDWWWSKAAFLMGIVYVCAGWFAIPFDEFSWLAILSISTIAGFASTGYLINDFFDREKDRKAGKSNFLEKKSPFVITLLFLISFCLLLFPWVWFPYDNISLVLIGFEICLLLIYSVAPFRLKERGFAGIVTDALYAHAVPVILAVYTFSLAGKYTLSALPVFLLFFWQLATGVRNILLHQIEDKAADSIAANKSWVAMVSEEFLVRIIKTAVAGEIIFSIPFFLFISFSEMRFLSVVILIVALIILVYMRFRERSFEEICLNSRINFPNNIFEKWVPPVLLFSIALADNRYLLIFFIHLALFNFNFYTALIYSVLLPLWYRLKSLLVETYIAIRRIISFIINQIIYNLFLIFQVDLKKEKMSAMDFLRKRGSHK